MSEQDIVPQSPSWEERKDVFSFFQPGYPYQEGFPRLYGGKTYTIITRAGEHLLARVDASRQYMAEGLQWETVNGRRNVDPYIVIAWKEGDWVTPKGQS